MIDFTPWTDLAGDAGAAALVGAVVGLAFGIFAQRSRFCLRSAALETAGGRAGPALAVWLAALGAAILAVQAFVAAGLIEVSAVRALNSAGSLSGAIAGGLLLGAGMILARGCPGRHLVLAGTGNGRAWVVFTLFAMTALATISGPLSTLAQGTSSLWRLSPDNAQVLAAAGFGPIAGLVLGAAIMVGAVALSLRAGVSARLTAGGAGLGGVMAAGWALTSGLSLHTFEPTQVESASFTAPAANSLVYVASLATEAVSFDTGFIPAVLAGATLSALVFGEFRLQWFADLSSALRYGAGAVLMGFGSVLALGCTVGSVSNAALMLTTAWVALAAVWVGALATDRATAGNWQRTPEPSREAVSASWM